MIKIRILEAKGLEKLQMVTCGWWAMAQAPDTILVRVPEGREFRDTLKFLPAGTIRHEIKHLEQMAAAALAGGNFRAQYWLEQVAHGYAGNHFEAEARGAEADASIEYEIINREDFNV